MQMHGSPLQQEYRGILEQRKLRECEIYRKTHSGAVITCGNSNDTDSVGGKNEKNKNYLYYGT